jgi:hypothetical protein
MRILLEESHRAALRSVRAAKQDATCGREENLPPFIPEAQLDTMERIGTTIIFKHHRT